jgi:hypothetical protein
MKNEKQKVATENTTNEQVESTRDISNIEVESKQAEILHEMIEMVVRQTAYSYEEAKEKLIETKWDYKSVILNYVCADKKVKKNEIKKTLNQEIFSQIRKQMDAASDNYYGKR